MPSPFVCRRERASRRAAGSAGCGRARSQPASTRVPRSMRSRPPGSGCTPSGHCAQSPASAAASSRWPLTSASPRSARSHSSCCATRTAAASPARSAGSRPRLRRKPRSASRAANRSSSLKWAASRARSASASASRLACTSSRRVASSSSLGTRKRGSSPASTACSRSTRLQKPWMVEIGALSISRPSARSASRAGPAAAASRSARRTRMRPRISRAAFSVKVTARMRAGRRGSQPLASRMRR